MHAITLSPTAAAATRRPAVALCVAVGQGLPHLLELCLTGVLVYLGIDGMLRPFLAMGPTAAFTLLRQGASHTVAARFANALKLFFPPLRVHAEPQQRPVRSRLRRDGEEQGMENLSRRSVVGMGLTTLAAAGMGAVSFLAAVTPVSAQTGTTTTMSTATTAARRGRPGPGFGRGVPGGDQQAIATVLNLTLAQLRQQQASKSIAQIAQAQNVALQTVKDAITAAAKTRLDQAVTAGRITSAQETQQLTNLQANLDTYLNRVPGQRPTGVTGQAHSAGRRPGWGQPRWR